MIKVRNIDHVAIALPSLAGGKTLLADLFGLHAGRNETVAEQKTDVCFLTPAGPDAATAIELVAPAGNESLQRFLDKRGPGLHHVCFRVDDLGACLRDLKSAGVPLIDAVPRAGARGHLVAFIHPRATGGVLFELCQHQGEGEIQT